MAVNTQRILKDAGDIAEDIAARSKKLYDETVEQLPENTGKYAGLALGGIALAAGVFFLGRSRRAEHVTEEDLKALDFKPFYRLARLWLIARMVD